MDIKEPQLNSLTFSHPMLSAGPFVRSIARIVLYVVRIVALGAIVAFLISDVRWVQAIGIALLLFFVDYLLHFSSAPYSLRDLIKGRAPQNNVAFCLRRSSLRLLIQTYERVEALGGDFSTALLETLTSRSSVGELLKRLEISPAELGKRAANEYRRSCDKPSLTGEEIMKTVLLITQKAAEAAYIHNRDNIGEDMLFLGLSALGEGGVMRVYDIFGIRPEDIDEVSAFVHLEHVRKLRIPAQLGGFALSMARVKPHRVNRSLTSRPTPVLDQFSYDLTDYARRGQAGFLIGHQEVYRRMIDILSRPDGQRNVLLIGEAGVGKDALVRHLAFHIVSDHVPGPLFDRRLVSLSVGELISGATQDELTQRIHRVAQEILRAGNIILFIPDLHLLTKSSGEGAVDLADLLMPIIRNSNFPVIGSTFPKEYTSHIQTRSDIDEVFESIRIQEITSHEATTLLAYEAVILEKKYRITIHFSAVKQAVDLAAKYLRRTPLPSSAQDLLKEAVADATQRGEQRLMGDDVIAIVERKIHVPIHKTSREEARELLTLEPLIHQRFINQENAVKRVAQALRAYRSGIVRGKGPISVFLFVGPTGVGKTELSKILTDIHFGSEKQMVRFDMSEYQDKESLVRFIGSPDGAIAGTLTETIIQKPYTLILLDEFEKAHHDILNLFLQVFDEGRLTDSLGRVVDFSNTIIIATSNAQSRFIQDQVRAGKSSDDFHNELRKKLTEQFSPELLNRFSDVIVFQELSPEHIRAIAHLKLLSMSRTIKQSQGIELLIDESAQSFIAQKGYQPEFGARPIGRAIDEYFSAPLSEHILAGDFVRGDEVFVQEKEGSLVFSKKEKE